MDTTRNGRRSSRNAFVTFIFDAGKALIARSLFIIHAFITFWRVSDIYEDPMYYLLLIPVVLLVIEFPVTTKCSRTGEWKWICPSLFLYILSVVPGLWFLQLDAFNSRIEHEKISGTCGTYVTNTTKSVDGLLNIQGIQIPLTLSSTEWTLALEQVLLVLLIFGKWLLPRGSLSRDQLAQLLIGHIGVAADSLEFSLESLKEESVLCDKALIIIILSIWSWSLMQFCINTTAEKTESDLRESPGEEGLQQIWLGCCRGDTWGLLVSVILQDAPYLAMRLYLVAYVGAIHQMILFFTCMNILIISLQFYRIGIFCFHSNDDNANSDTSNEGLTRDRNSRFE